MCGKFRQEVGIHIVLVLILFVWYRFTMGAAAYQLGNTSSRTITEVKQR